MKSRKPKFLQNLPVKDQEVREIHNKVWKYLSDLMDKDELYKFNVDDFFAASSYAEAIYSFQKEGINPDNWSFICQNETLLKYAANLRYKFLIKVLSVEESKKEEKEIKAVGKVLERNWVMGSPMLSDKYHQGSEITEKEWRNLQPELKDKFKSN